MTDDLPLALAAGQLGQPVSVLRHPTATQSTLLRLLAPRMASVTDAYFKSLVILEDIGQNSFKRKRYLEIREAMTLLSPMVTSVPGVMLLRGGSGERRRLVNEQEVAKALVRRGWRVLDPQVDTVAEIARWCAGAKIVLGVEGSHLTNGMMCMPSGSALLVLQPPNRFCMVLKHYCDCVDSPYAFVVGHPEGTDTFRVSVDAVSRMIDRVS